MTTTTTLRAFLALLFVGGMLICVAWWYLMPQGFPVGHPRFWMNTVFPLVGLGVCLLGAAAAVRNEEELLAGIMIVGTSAIFAVCLTSKFIFPDSISGTRSIFMAVAATGALGLLIWWRPRSQGVQIWIYTVCILIGGSVGAFVPRAQQGAAPGTKPIDVATPDVKIEPLPSMKPVKIDDGVLLYPQSSQLAVSLGEVDFYALPLLTFRSRSPDRCWTVFAPAADRLGPDRSLLGLSQANSSGVTLNYADDGQSRLSVRKGKSRQIDIEATSSLPAPIYSHLNSFCELQIAATDMLAVSFSACPKMVEMKPSDYPVGRPVRLAYLDSDRVFRVVEGTSGEKGPFITLVEGSLGEDEPLQMTIYHARKAVCEITLEDWAAQCSTQLSPTAGWGLPENAIEFSSRRHGAKNNSGVIYVTLAATSVGRGWDSVGHAAGVYRNRMTIKPIEP